MSSFDACDLFQLLTAIYSRKHTQRPQIILLKEGTDTSQGKAQIISNINACQVVADAVRSTLYEMRAACLLLQRSAFFALDQLND